MRLLSGILLIGGCSTPSEDTGIETDFCERPSIEDGSIGTAFLLNYCTGCHSSENNDFQRHGAPGELNYDSHAGFSQHLDRVRANCAIDTTHPCDDIPKQEVEEFLNWIDCGAPSTQAEMPEFSAPDQGESFEVVTRVVETPEGFEMTRYIELGSRGFFPETPWSVTWFERYENELWLFSETLYRADGSILSSIDFGTGLLIARTGRTELTDTLEVSIEEDGTVVTEVIDFSANRGDGAVLDGRESNHDPNEIHITSSHGLEWIWHYGDTGPATMEANWLDDERSWMALGIQDYQGPPLEILGLTDGGQWVDRIHIEGRWSQ